MYVCMYVYIYIYTHIYTHIYIYIYIYVISLSLSIYIYIYGGFPRPGTIKHAKADAFYERDEESIPYESKKPRGSMKQAYPTLLGMLAWLASGYS